MSRKLSAGRVHSGYEFIRANRDKYSVQLAQFCEKSLPCRVESQRVVDARVRASRELSQSAIRTSKCNWLRDERLLSRACSPASTIVHSCSLTHG